MSSLAAVAPRPRERHRSTRIGWLRAAVLGANDGIVSTASLVIGIAAAQSSREQVLVAGVAGLVAGAMSMAAGEYVSVSSQSDTERADLAIERAELAADPDIEREELADIYVMRGLDATLAREVADQLMAHDALGAHARDELGFSHVITARPVQAALASAGIVRRRRGDAAPHGGRRARARHGHGHRRHVAALPDRSWRRRRRRRRCARVARCAARRLLGRAGHGVHGLVGWAFGVSMA